MASSKNFRSWLPRRSLGAHKNDFGHVLVIGGSRGMMGAPRLAALGALHGGAGLVTIGTPKSLEPIVALGPWEAMTLPLLETAEKVSAKALPGVQDFLNKRRVTSVALGPGMGGGNGVVEFVRSYLASVSVPTVLDADGLNALASIGPIKVDAPLILTPHPGEMSRLLNTTVEAVQKNRRSAVCEAARRFKAVVILKGQGTLVSDGDQFFKNTTGNPGMAAGGMGDVLAGLMAALIGQLVASDLRERLWRAAILGVYLHGLAGDIAFKEKNSTSLLASDVAQSFPKAFRLLFKNQR